MDLPAGGLACGAVRSRSAKRAVARRADSFRGSRTGASQSGETLGPPPPLLCPASPMHFVIQLLGLRRRQLAPDLPNAQFKLSATKQTELVDVRALYIHSNALWGVEVLFALVGGSAPKPPPALRPASPMRFVIFLLGLRRLQFALDLSNAQFILSATKQTELVKAAPGGGGSS